MIRATLTFIALTLFCSAAIAEEPVILGQGSFVKKFKPIEGTFLIRQVGDKRELVLDEAFKTKKGPDLQIIFSPLTIEQAENGNADGKGSLSIGLLQSNKGAQSYELPADLELTQYRSLLIHCVKYTKLWGGASL